jgi:hypothetical protein
VDENVLAAIIAHDEAEALLRVEEFDDAFAFADHLGGHAAARTTATAAAAETATAAAAEAITATAATAEAITAAAETIAAATAEAITAPAETITAAEAATAIATEAFVTEAIALVPAAALAAPPSIETHAVKVFPNVAPLRRKANAPGQRTNLSARKISHAKHLP